MKIVSKEQAESVYRCHREIEAGEKLLVEVQRVVNAARNDASTPLGLVDAYGRERGLQLGVPCSDNAHRLFDVPWRLAVPIIKAHIAEKQAELELLSAAIAFAES